MEKYKEIQYIHYLHLNGIVKKEFGYNFKCPICHGDDGKNRKRGYLLTKKDNIVYFCHHCNISMTFKKFIEVINPTLYEEYLKEESKDKLQLIKEKKFLGTKKEAFEITKANPEEVVDGLKLFNFHPKYFIPATQVKECVEYAERRKIPQEVFQKMYYNIHPKMPFSNMLIFPFWKGDKVYGFQGRSLVDKRFYNFSRNESFKIYNIFNVDLTKPVYIFESIIDSLHVGNAVASLGVSLSPVARAMIKYPVYVFDNDKAGRVASLKYVEADKDNNYVFIMPSEYKNKDFNDMAVNSGWTNKGLEILLKENIFKGLSAITKLKMRMRNKK